MTKAEIFLKEKGIHPTEPIYWDLVNKTIPLNELMEEYHQSQLKPQEGGFDINYFVSILKRTLDGNEEVRVEFENEEDNINYILDVCNNFKKELEKDTPKGITNKQKQ